MALSLDEIEIDPVVSVRAHADDAEEERRIDHLARSILEQGQLSPVLVRRSATTKKYLLIAGHRRVRAIALIEGKMGASWPVSAMVVDKNDEQAWDAAFSENYHRRDFSPIELAQNITALRKRKKWPEEEWIDNASRYLDLSRSTVTQHLKLLKLPFDVQDKIHLGRLAAQAGFDLVAHEEARQAAGDQTVPDASEVVSRAEQKARAEEQKQAAERKAKGLPPRPDAKGRAGAPIKRKHVLAAAREADVPGMAKKARTRFELLSFLEELMGPHNPHSMQRFLEGLTGKWVKGGMSDHALITRWEDIIREMQQKTAPRKGRVA